MRKQPYFIRPRDDDAVLAMAGLLARWSDPDGQDIISACIITTSPNAEMAPIHVRMPVLLTPENFDQWLDPDNQDKVGLSTLLQPAEPGRLVAYPVATVVNRAGNEGPHLIDPFEQPSTAA